MKIRTQGVLLMLIAITIAAEIQGLQGLDLCQSPAEDILGLITAYVKVSDQSNVLMRKSDRWK